MGKCYASKLIAWAKAEIGYLEKASNADLDDPVKNSGHANWNKFAAYIDANFPDWYNGKKNGYDWCDVFFDCGMLQCFGYEDALRLTCQPEHSYGAGCKYSLGYYRSQGRFVSSDPQPGDQIFFGTSFESVSHTGLVVAVDTLVHTIEGNVSDGVRACSYPLGAAKILGYGRPAYDLEDDDETGCGCTALAAEVEKLETRISSLEKQLKTYHTFLDLPEWAKPEIRKLIEAGVLFGTKEDGSLDLTPDLVRALVILARILYGDKEAG